MKITIGAIFIFNLAMVNAFAAFGGKPPLRSDEGLRHEFAPYNIPEVNYLGANYNENLLDMRNNIVSYTHMGFEANNSDAWNLHFPDDAARFLEGIAWEADYSPVARIELARRVAKGLISAHVPGTQAYYFFRHRSGGKTELTFDNLTNKKDGRVALATWGDAIAGEVKIGFRVEIDSKWHEVEEFQYKDKPERWGEPGVARSPVNWNLSPYSFQRDYRLNEKSVLLNGKYWMSDEDMPLEYEFASSDADRLQIVIGDPNNPMPLLAVGNGNEPGIINLPDRTTKYLSDKNGDVILKNPTYKYIVLSKNNSWGAPGYGSACLIMWNGSPEYIEGIAKNGYGEIRISYKAKGRKAGGKVWLFPFPIVNQDDMEHVYRNAESFLKNGRLIHNGFPPQQMFNAIPAGLAAGAYILTKYNDPMAPTVTAHAVNAIDETFSAERSGKQLIRVFFPVRAASWMVKTSKLLGNKDMETKYTEDLELAAKRMLSSQSGYDGKGWPDGWTHFNCTKSIWLAYDATGNEEYRQAFERALSVYTIDQNGIYRYGKKMDAPGGFETYFGSMPMGVWGMAGKLDWANQLLELNVPSEPGAKTMAKDLWHDDGNGPWSQDDANPEYVGLSLRGLSIPQDPKHIISVGSFPIYDEKGNVRLEREPIVINPFFLRGDEEEKVVSAKDVGASVKVSQVDVRPGSVEESKYLVKQSGKVIGNSRVCTGKDSPIVYRFDASGAAGAGIDVRIKGSGYRIDVSPDGERWYERLDTWSNEPKTQSIDVSFLTGNREELLNLMTIVPGRDAKWLYDKGNSRTDSFNRRYTGKNGSFVYRIDLPQVTQCFMELMLGNSYIVECSADAETWTKVADPTGFRHDKEAAFIRMIDVSPFLEKGTLFIRVSDQDTEGKYGNDAFIRRLTLYGVLRTDNIYMRLTNVHSMSNKSFDLEGITFRKW